MDVNPYQPPREPDPLQKKQAVKRAIGMATVLILTPVAVLIAAGASCTAAVLIADTLPLFGNSTRNAAIVVPLVVFIVPPVLVLIAMIGWAIRASLRSKN